MLSSFKPRLYVQVSPDRLTVRNVKTGEVLSEVPEIAISSDSGSKVLGVGAEARTRAASSSARVVNPFAHPRSLMSDFTAGEQLLKHFLRRMQSSSLFAASPSVVLHLAGNPDGGFTQVEVRAFREMALGAGASEVTIWQGRALSDQEVITKQFPTVGQVLS